MLRRPFLAVLLAASLSASLGAGCKKEEFGATPDGVVREFVELLTGFRGNDDEAKALYELLSQRAQRNLKERAARYGAASGKQMSPWAMIVPARMIPRFAPQSYQAQLAGRYAMVELRGSAPEHRAQIPCVLEDERWRVDIVLPELPPMRRRLNAPEE